MDAFIIRPCWRWYSKYVLSYRQLGWYKPVSGGEGTGGKRQRRGKDGNSADPLPKPADDAQDRWLRRVLAAGSADPTRLGFGQVTIKAKELRQYGGKGGRLDILAYDAALDTYYEVEVMLGECDADHGFRALGYWARERVRNPNTRHVAVIVAEDLSGRW